MPELSIIVPQRNAGHLLATQLSDLCPVLDSLDIPYEVIIVDDASAAPTMQLLEALLWNEANLRVIQLDQPSGLSAALSAGLANARGETVVVIEAGPRFSAEAIPLLLEHLSRADLVCGRPRRNRVSKAWHRLLRIPRWFLLGLEVRDPDVLFWAARREAVTGLHLPRGMYRYLATLVTLRGYRVSEVAVTVGSGRACLTDGWANPGDLLAAWWLKRRWRRFAAQEITSDDLGRPRFRIATFDAAEEQDAPRPAEGLDRDTHDRRAS